MLRDPGPRTRHRIPPVHWVSHTPADRIARDRLRSAVDECPTMIAVDTEIRPLAIGFGTAGFAGIGLRAPKSAPLRVKR